MSNRAMAWAIDVTGIDGIDRLILMLLADCHNGKTGQCNPGIEWLQDRTKLGERALQTRLKALEAKNLLQRERSFLGRGRGSEVSQYNLKIGILGSVQAPKIEPHLDSVPSLEPHDNAPALECARILTSLDPHLDSVPYKEEPEKNRNNISTNSEILLDQAFEKIWAAWSRTGKDRSDSKAICKQALKRQTKHGSLEDITKAALVYAKTTDGNWHKGLQRWLSKGRWQNYLGRDMGGEVKRPHRPEDWERWCNRWALLDQWGCPDSPPPDHPDCKAPRQLIEYAIQRKAKEMAA